MGIDRLGKGIERGGEKREWRGWRERGRERERESERERERERGREGGRGNRQRGTMFHMVTVFDLITD